jgi:hypothetical protein
MSLLPYENYFIESTLSESEIISRLQEQIEPKQYVRFAFLKDKNSYKPYEGLITGSTFKINRVIRYRNAFLPMIIGEVLQNGSRSRIHIKMQMMTAAVLFMIFWIFISLFIGGVFIIIASGNPGFSFAGIVPVVLLLFGYSMAIFGFSGESTKAKQFLKDLFQADEVM